MKLRISLITLALAATMSACASPTASGPYPDFTEAAENSINGVVSIKSYASPKISQYGGGGFSDPFLEYFFGGRPQQRQQPQQTPREQQLGLGSGVILSPDGYLVTNNHVIDGAERLEVTLNDNRTFDATVIGSDAATDLALLKIEADEKLPVIPMGDSDALKVGEWVLAVGNPFGFTSTVTAGIVSAKARSLGGARNGRMSIESYIQTDAAVNPGNSGGALVNTAGELVGINTAIYSQTGNYAGYSFAIPASIVTKIVADIKEYGAVQRAVLGVSFMPLTPELSKEKNITGINDGIYVAEVVERSAAFEAGIQPGDIIVEIDGNPTHTSAQLQEQLARKRPGDKIEITYLRNGDRKKVTTTLRNASGGTETTQRGDFSALGCALKPLDAESLRRLNLSAGLQVTGLTDGKFREAGIRQGFIILDVNGNRVRSVEDLEKIYDAIKDDTRSTDKVMFITGIYPTGRKTYYAVDLAD